MTSNHGIRLSVVILSYNGMSHLPECLESISGQTVQPHEVILVDNGSIDGSPEWVRTHYPGIRTIPLPENRGSSKNAGET